MKKLQKFLMAFAICLLSIVVVGCSSKDNKDNKDNTTTTSENNTTGEDSKNKNTGKLTNEELAKKFDEATKSMKSSKAKVKNNTSMDLAGKKTSTSMDMDVTMTLDPFVFKVGGKMTTLGRSVDMDMYITKEATYVKNTLTKTWLKIADPTMKSSFESQKNVGNLEGMVELFKSIGDKAKVEEKDSGYEITYSGTDDAVKEALKKIMSSSQPKAKGLLDGMEVSKLNIRYVIDKKTFFPKEYEMTTTVKLKQNDKELSFDMDLKASQSEINEVKEITIPDEVKNAKEWNKN